MSEKASVVERAYKRYAFGDLPVPGFQEFTNVPVTFPRKHDPSLPIGKILNKSDEFDHMRVGDFAKDFELANEILAAGTKTN